MHVQFISSVSVALGTMSSSGSNGRSAAVIKSPRSRQSAMHWSTVAALLLCTLLICDATESTRRSFSSLSFTEKVFAQRTRVLEACARTRIDELE